MFIAFKWLVAMAMAMWLAMCFLDLYLKNNKKIQEINVSGCTINPTLVFKSKTKQNIERIEKQTTVKDKRNNMATWHCAMFVSGAIAVSLFNRKKEIILYTKDKLISFNYKQTIENTRRCLNVTAIMINVAILKYTKRLWAILKVNYLKFKMHLNNFYRQKYTPISYTNIGLLQKLKEIGEERKRLGQLLIAAFHENKNIRLQYQLESMAKNRLVRNIEAAQKRLKENISRYVSFQQLYLVTNQENIFLKLRIKKLTKEKEDAERKLTELLNEVYKSKNKELKTYCSRFIVNTRNNLLNSDVNSEIQKFLENYKRPETTKTISQYEKQSKLDVNAIRSKPRCGNAITAVIEEDCLMPLVSDAPKLKGLPGECIWTVKDKDGIIEKLYEYDYESDFDNGDTIRRIREYSVYHDKDCLLDFTRSRTIIQSTASEETLCDQYRHMHRPLASERFLTGSRVFKRFLQLNTNVVSSARAPVSSLRI